MTNQDIEDLVVVEEQRLRVGSHKFRKRHKEIMEELKEILLKNREDRQRV